MTTKKYLLKGDMPLLMDGKLYADGDTVDIDEAAAAAHVAAGRLEPVTTPTPNTPSPDGKAPGAKAGKPPKE
ncbi:hypothetical protein [Varunaivibrio sulfuroxidans]|uniref:Uncharacterized protein n=1 Tax=Varunaivibrio sulfuroxidans TaxID=1773489 RepID=A0A4V2UNL8_9PROT|nr:hypothetical protein [Varunaivibrio sulfuroxidans]TCS62581.1 hypothetical protein EDD55_105127 [Varunaivibrio sulfuroxidans]WES30750.1 hypothetical protein P3M64_14135 [Varunaivibrio sulfuroxidans]